MYFLLFLVLGVFSPALSHAACTGASPTWSCPAASLSADLTTLFASGSYARNDTVNVTGSGTVAWSGATLTKGVRLIGPGRDVLTLTRSSTHLTIAPDSTAITNEDTILVQGFTFDGNEAAGLMIDITGAGSAATKPFKNLAIYLNRIKTPATSSSAIWVDGQVRGVISSNHFDSPQILLRCLGGNDYDYHTNAAFYPVTLGGSDNLFFENNLIDWATNPFSGDNFQGWTECGQSGRAVFRYNTWDFGALADADEHWDIHGFQNGESGSMLVEYYGNKLINSNDDERIMFQRGGTMIVLNNVRDHAVTTGYELGNYDVNGCVAENGITGSQINDSYYVNNEAPAGTTEIPSNHPGDNYNGECPPVHNTDYWRYDASCTGSACSGGIGRGTTVPTGTCSNGAAFWVASISTLLQIGADEAGGLRAINQAGKLYKCAAPNTWTVKWQPYTYPHPLVGGSVSTPSRFNLNLNLRRASYDLLQGILNWFAPAGPVQLVRADHAGD